MTSLHSRCRCYSQNKHINTYCCLFRPICVWSTTQTETSFISVLNCSYVLPYLCFELCRERILLHGKHTTFIAKNTNMLEKVTRTDMKTVPQLGFLLAVVRNFVVFVCLLCTRLRFCFVLGVFCFSLSFGRAFYIVLLSPFLSFLSFSFFLSFFFFFLFFFFFGF